MLQFLSLDDLQYGKNIDLREDFDSREVSVFEPRHEKTVFLPMRKQRRRSAVQ